jgi:hypothetical protein
MNASIHASNIESALPISRFFEVGHFVRIRGTEDTGRIIEVAENENYAVCVFGETNHDEQFYAGYLETWSPHTVAAPLDIERLQELAMRQLGAFKLIGDLVKTALKEDPQADHDDILDTIEILADTFADMTGEVVEMVQTEIFKQQDEIPACEHN